MGRRAPRLRNPIQANPKNLESGRDLYQTHCAACHGSPSNPRSAVGLGPYPPAPQFLEEAPDMPEYQNFYIIRNGIRRTGMPSWLKVLSTEQIWQLTTFLAHIDHLPLAIEQEWKRGQPAMNAKHERKEK